MALSKSQALANARYNDKTYDTLAIRIKKGIREIYKDEAAKRGLSLAMLVKKGVEEYIKNHAPTE